MHLSLFHIIVVLVALIGRPFATTGDDPVDVLDYHVTLRLEPDTRYIEGETQITVRHDEATKELLLTFGAIQIEAIRVNDSRVPFSLRDAKIVVPLAGGDTSVVSIRYKGIPDTGLYARAYKGQQVIYTDSWWNRGRGWLPAVHHPSDPATFTLSLDVPSGYEVIATGLSRDVEHADGRNRYRFEMSQPVPTYSFAFAVSDFSVHEERIPGSLLLQYDLLASDAEYVHKLDFVPQVLAFYSELIGPYPFEHFSVVQIPLDYPGMENAATVFIQAGRFEDGRLSGVIAHEAAHQWFGNAVVIQSWRDLWLNEAIASYLTTLYQGYVDGIERSRRVWAGMAEVGPGREPTLYPLASAGSAGNGPRLTWETYEKGASVLHTLRLKIGDAAFFSGLQEIYRAYLGIPLTTEAFQEVMERVSDSNLDAFFESWVHGVTLPTLRTTWNESSGLLGWEILDDRGMLEGVSFLLEVTQGDQVHYVGLSKDLLQLSSDVKERPRIRPVGIMMYVE